MAISYVLRKISGEWYVIKDHVTSVEKSADSEGKNSGRQDRWAI